MKRSIKVHAFTEVIQRFGVDPKTAVQNMLEKHITGTKQGNNGLSPGVFALYMTWLFMT